MVERPAQTQRNYSQSNYIGKAAAVAVLSLSDLIFPTTLRASEPPLAGGNPVSGLVSALDPAPKVALAEKLDSQSQPSGTEILESRRLSLDKRPENPRFLFGGGDYDPEAMRLFAAWSGGKDGVVVAISWASETRPQANFDHFAEALEAAGGARPIKLPEFDEFGGDFQAAKRVIEGASAVMVTGGDQHRLIKQLQASGLDRVISSRVKQNRLIYAGTSAGTAVASPVMIAGPGSVPAEHSSSGDAKNGSFFWMRGGSEVISSAQGSKIVVEQHFLRANRLERLQEAMSLKESIKFGIGIDDGGCAVVTGRAGQMMLYGIGAERAVHVFCKTDSANIEKQQTLLSGNCYQLGATLDDE